VKEEEEVKKGREERRRKVKDGKKVKAGELCRLLF
jgi:hypothetical protein